MASQLLLLELNEVNFEFVEAYTVAGKLPVLASLLQRHGLARTTSEQSYERLEPWIQWVTAHTGLSFDEHGVFRLGDIVKHNVPQIWERLEAEGFRVGAISPMNAKHRAKRPAFFVPDPWTPTDVTASSTLRKLYEALVQVVNDNAQAKVGASSLRSLLLGTARFARPQNYQAYLRIAMTSLKQSWRRAIFLDLLLADVFIREVARSRPNFASLFLNAAAHIQHHYMFSAAPYAGNRKNPDWYIRPGLDPILEVYQAYDRIVGQIARKFPHARLMLATGLHQEPHDEATFYWRLRDHGSFLRTLGVAFDRVEPRMSRDFAIFCADESQARDAASILNSVKHDDGAQLFEVENRGRDLFVMLSYPMEIRKGDRFRVGEQLRDGLFDHVVFVAIKNGQHDGIGYFIDTGLRSAADEFPLKEIPRRIFDALGVSEAELNS